jgi:hypothetical protein
VTANASGSTQGSSAIASYTFDFCDGTREPRVAERDQMAGGARRTEIGDRADRGCGERLMQGD